MFPLLYDGRCRSKYCRFSTNATSVKNDVAFCFILRLRMRSCYILTLLLLYLIFKKHNFICYYYYYYDVRSLTVCGPTVILIAIIIIYNLEIIHKENKKAQHRHKKKEGHSVIPKKEMGGHSAQGKMVLCRRTLD